jgi:siroheme synthase-like protein
VSTPYPNGFPVIFDLGSRPCLLVGAGRIAFRKAEQLLKAGAELTVVAPQVLPEFESLPVRIVRREFQATDLDGVWLVVTATGNTEVDQFIFDQSESRRIWCNSADDPKRCSFILPAVHRRGPITVAISTGGASPALASWLRAEIATLVGPEFEELVSRLAAERVNVKSAGNSTEDIDWKPIIASICDELGIVSVRKVTT